MRDRRVRNLLAARTASLLGSNFNLVAISFAALALDHGSPTGVALVLAASTLPTVAVVIFAGVWSDRMSRKIILVAADGVRCLSQGAVAWLLVSGHGTLDEILGLEVVLGVATAFFRPASTAVMPELVQGEDLRIVNAMVGLADSLAAMIGPALAGVLVAALDYGWAIAFDAVTFCVSGVLLFALPKDGGERASPTEGFLTDLREGFSELSATPWLWIAIVGLGLFQLLFLGSLNTLGPTLARNSLGGPAAWGLLLTVCGIGSVIGSAAAFRVRPARPLVGVFAACLSVAPAFILLAIPAPLGVIAGDLFLSGAAIAFAEIVFVFTLQEFVSNRMLSRMTSFAWLSGSLLYPVGLFAVAAVSGAVGIPLTLYATCGVFAAVFTVIVLCSPIRRFRSDQEAPLVGGE